MSEAAPVRQEDRIKSLDVLRGLAILGILMVNAPFFAASWHSTMSPSAPPLGVDAASLWSWLAMHTFFEFKFITLFSMLFGVSLFLVGGERSDKDRGKILRRRLSWLLVFGLIHGALIWYGDILLNYALTGFLLLLARSWRPLTLMIVGVVLTLLSSGLIGLSVVAMQYAPPEIMQQQFEALTLTPEEFAAIERAMNGDIMSVFRQNFEWWAQFLVQSLVFLVPRTAGIMMIGLALFKWGFMSGRSPVWLYVVFLVLGAAAFAATWVQGVHEFEAGFPIAMMQGEGTLLLSLLSPFGTLFYISLMILILKAGVLEFLTRALAAVGQIAFTNYITQSLIMTTIFWGGRGFGLFGQVDRPTLWLIVAAIWLLQLIWSPLWLSRFKMGPLEWIWRRLSYGKPVAIG